MTLFGKSKARRLAQLEAQASQWEGELAVERDARQRAEAFAAASLETVEKTADQWERMPERGTCAEELRTLVARLRAHRSGRVL